MQESSIMFEKGGFLVEYLSFNSKLITAIDLARTRFCIFVLKDRAIQALLRVEFWGSRGLLRALH